MRTFRIFQQWFSNDLTDIVFENRNQLYGAYELRKHYPARLKKSLLLTSGLCLLIIGISSWCMKNQIIVDVPPSVVDTIIDISDLTVVIENPPASHPPKPDLVHREDAPKVIVKDSAVDERKPDTTEMTPMVSGNTTGKSGDTSNANDGYKGLQPASGFVPFASSTQDEFILIHPNGRNTQAVSLPSSVTCKKTWIAHALAAM